MLRFFLLSLFCMMGFAQTAKADEGGWLADATEKMRPAIEEFVDGAERAIELGGIVIYRNRHTLAGAILGCAAGATAGSVSGLAAGLATGGGALAATPAAAALGCGIGGAAGAALGRPLDR